MCGIAAIVAPPNNDLRAGIEQMVASIHHRGPDDSGLAVLPEDGVALGMRRLSILDLEGGHQPMWSEDREHCVVFNGEIYNFAELREDLVARGHRFETRRSDTEVLVHGFEEWGPDLFERLNGMFAVAIWDRRRRELTIARDRAGEKPLYLGQLASGYAVCSEMKGLLSLPSLQRRVDAAALEQYLAFDYVVGPRTILQDVHKLPAGHVGVLTSRGWSSRQYWEPSFSRAVSRARGEADDLERLDELLGSSVRARMIADVPVGLFLSGGLDSTTVGYYMRRHSEDVHSFSIGFEEDAFDESSYARLAAKALGTKHHLEVFSQDRVRELVPRIAEILDEPMGDPSILPTFLLSTFTREAVKVALGGDGSDELLMGYKAYRPLKVAWLLQRLPGGLRSGIAGAARRFPSHLGSASLRGVQFARMCDGDPVSRLLSHLGSFKGDARWVLSPEMRAELPTSPFAEASPTLLNGWRNLTAADQTVAAYVRGYLQEDILVKVDRASMAASLEVRAPFLDPELMEFLFLLPTALKLRGFTGKYLLRQLMRGRIPDEIIDRPKVGFGVPLSAWLRDSLAPLVRECLAPSRLAAAGNFDPVAVSKLVDEHLSGARDHGRRLWLLLQFELWRTRWLG